MCKVFGVTGVNEKNRSVIIQIMKDIVPSMTKFENDGLGYAAINKEGKVFGEKWVNPKDAFKKRFQKKIQPASVLVPNLDKPILEQFHDVIDYSEAVVETFSPPIYDRFGDGKMQDAVSFILHSRWSTGGKDSINIQNTHPFMKNGTAMIHNGVVYNEDDFKKESSTCDSEILLNQYEKHNINMDSRSMTDAFKNVDAYFACLFLTQTITEKEEMVPILDVFQNGASLKIIHVHQLNATFFVTNSQDLIDVCKKKGLSTSRAFGVSENVLIRINAITGQVIEKQEFDYEVSYKWSPSNNTHDSVMDDDKSEAYLKSRYGADWRQHEMRDGMEHDLDAPAYRNEPTLYDATRFPYQNEMDEFRKQAVNKDDELVTYIGNRKY